MPVTQRKITAVRPWQDFDLLATSTVHVPHFFAATSSRMLDVVSGVEYAPAAGKSYFYDSSLRAIYTDAAFNSPVSAALAGSFASASPTTLVMILYAGYAQNLIADFGHTDNTCRFAIGDINDVLGQGSLGFGLSDGITAGFEGHTEIGGAEYDGGTGVPAGRYKPLAGVPLSQTIINAIGTATPYFRYALYRPGTAPHVETGAYKLDGTPIVVADTIYQGDSAQQTFSPVAAGRFHGVKLCGAAVMHFPSEPVDYFDRCKEHAALWVAGKKTVYPYKWT